MNNDKKAFILACFAVVFWSTVATAFKISLSFVTPIQLLAFASLFSSLVLFLVIILQNKLKSILSVSLKDLIISFGIGFFNPFLYYFVLFKAYSLLPAQEALALNYTWAIVLTILTSVVQKKKVRFVAYLALFVSFFGVLIIISKGSIVALRPSNTLGAILAISSSLIWGFSWIMNLMSKLDVEIRLFFNFIFGSIFSFIALLINQGFVIPNLLATISIFYVATFEMGVTFVLWNKALKNASNPAKINNLIYASPLISVLFINLFLKEKILGYTLLGLLLIILGILMQNTPFAQIKESKDSVN
ncbi:MAG: DMT family transporter [Ignavibacteria bacterium]|nr:DMT family transporter [Ignavibacteria bacterium]